MGTIFDIKRYAIHDGPGIRTTVFFKGCPLRCRWCHNPEGILREPEPPLVTRPGARETIGREIGVHQLLLEIERDEIFYDESGGGVTFSGGEPLDQPEFLRAVLRCCRARRIHTALDSCCYVPWEVLSACSRDVDLMLCDLKHMNSEAHRAFTGVPNEPILENVRRLAANGNQVTIRLPVIPGANDDEENTTAAGRFIASLPGVQTVDLLPYNGTSPAKQVRLAERVKPLAVTPPTDERLQEIKDRLETFDLVVNRDG
jgi:pyruvate formate lyase activating enzyme